MSEPLDERCPRCGTELEHEPAFWSRLYVARCESCRFEGIESPTARLIAWLTSKYRRSR